MRPSLPIAALVTTLSTLFLAACATAPEPKIKAPEQSGVLKVHPGLLGQAVPPELQAQTAPAEAGSAPGGTPTEPALLPAEGSVFFDRDSASLKNEASTLLSLHARYLLQHPAARLRIEGHADERGSPEHNRKLGLKRAEAVKQALLGQGVPEKRIRATSLGNTQPRRKGHDESSWAENRRADLQYENGI